MKWIICLTIIFTSHSTFAGTTCSKGSRTVLSCFSKDGTQVDVCKRSTLFQIRVNGEVYAAEAEKSVTDGVLAFQGINYAEDRFILEQRDSSMAVLTEVNKFEMPICEDLELTCN
jgi:hypothetical protein